MKNITWFTDRIGQTVKRTTTDAITRSVRVSWQLIRDEKTADYLFDIQSEHIQFSDPREAVAENTCTTCEG